MAMAVMQIGIMRVPMHEPGVPVPMRVRFAGRVGQRMRVLVMVIVIMPMLMLHRLVQMVVFVPLGHM